MNRYTVEIALPIRVVIHATNDKEAHTEAVRVAYESITPEDITEAWALWAERDDPTEIIAMEEVDSVWIVETSTIIDGWTNTWSSEEVPQTFASYADALAELGELFQEVAAANKDGRMICVYDPQDYRIREVMPSNTDEA